MKYSIEEIPTGWKCTSSMNKHWQTFGSTPTQALEAYITKEITNIFKKSN